MDSSWCIISKIDSSLFFSSNFSSYSFSQLVLLLFLVMDSSCYVVAKIEFLFLCLNCFCGSVGFCG